MSAKPERPILIVKRVKRAEGAHHGGAWKVAYADFVTAMMAFFLVMWLIASVSKDQRAAIFEYFKNPSMESGKSSHPAPSQAGPGGASTSLIQLGGTMDAHATPGRTLTKLAIPDDARVPLHDPALTTERAPEPTSEEEAQKVMAAAEHQKLESLMAELRQAIDKSQALKPFKDQLLLDIAPEGLRIQIVDNQNRPMFDLGSAQLKPYTGEILRVLAPYLNTVPNRLSLSGHTDTTPYTGRAGYNNWDLSADRANAARRSLEAGGLAPDKVARIVGLSSAVLFNKDDPRAAINRRISIIVMTRQAEQAALNTDASQPVSASSLATQPGGVPSQTATTPAAAAGVAAPGSGGPVPAAAVPPAARSPAPAPATSAIVPPGAVTPSPAASRPTPTAQ